MKIKDYLQENEKLKNILDHMQQDRINEAQNLKENIELDTSEKIEYLKKTHAKNISLYEE
jgi:hypothetical protein